MALSDGCKRRLYNWKFEQAYAKIREEKPTDRETYLLRALAKTYGNVGWFDGYMSEIVSAAVRELVGEEFEDADEEDLF